MSFISVAYYHSIFFNSLLVFTFFVFIQTKTSILESLTNKKITSGLGLILMLLLILFIGFRPVNFRFGDMVIYDRELEVYRFGAAFDYSKDIIFEFLKYVFAKYFSSTSFFFFCALLYIVPLYSVSKKLFKDYWFYGFLMFVTSFSFWAYGVNGIRNGIATSVFLYGMTREKKSSRILILLSTFFIHKSMLIPIFAYFVSKYYKNTKVLFAVWIIAIPLSFVVGGFFESLFLGFGFGDEKLELYLGEFDAANEGVNLDVGFRWDFLVYSGFGIFAVWYYLFKRKLNDPFYTNIANMYIIANTFWVLVIRANYSNRFAYLSWFMLGLVIVYPLLKRVFFNEQNKILGNIILIYFLFTYLVNIYLS